MQFFKIYYHIYTEYSTPCGIALFFSDNRVQNTFFYSLSYKKQSRRKGFSLFFGSVFLYLLQLFTFYASSRSSSGSRFVMLFKLIASVELLCSSADIDGVMIPATPKRIKPKLKLMTKR